MSRRRLVQESSPLSMRRDDRASMQAGTWRPQAWTIRAQMSRAALSLARVCRYSPSADSPSTMPAKACSGGNPAVVSALA